MTDTLTRPADAEQARARMAERASVLAARKAQRDELAGQLAAAEAALAAERDAGGDVLGPAALVRELQQQVADVDAALEALHRLDAEDRAVIDREQLEARALEALEKVTAAAIRDQELVAGLPEVFRQCVADAAAVADRLIEACSAVDSARGEVVAAVGAVNELRRELGGRPVEEPPNWLSDMLREVGAEEPKLAALWFAADRGRLVALRGLLDVLATREPLKPHGFV